MSRGARGDPKIARADLLARALLVAAVVLLASLWFGAPYLAAWIAEPIDIESLDIEGLDADHLTERIREEMERSDRLAFVMGICLAVPTLGLSYYFAIGALRTLREKRYPPRGYRVPFATPVWEGPAARRMAACLLFGAVVELAMAAWLLLD